MFTQVGYFWQTYIVRIPNRKLLLKPSFPFLATTPQVAQTLAELGHFPRAIELYESIARTSVESNLLKYR